MAENGGKYSFRLECNKASAKDLDITAHSLHGLYVNSGLLKRLLIGVVFKWLGGARDDQAIAEIRKGSLLVELQCFTDTRFMDVWEDYESGELKKRLQVEFSACEFEVEELKIDIKNWEEVNETRKQIDNRMKDTEKSAPRKRVEEVTSKKPGIIVQGGTYSSGTNEYREEFLLGIKQAAKAGYDVLMQEGKTAVDAVEEAVRIMENDAYFNAGVGSFSNKNDEVECDAMIMDGNTMKTGAVMAVKHFTNPVLLSRKVMEETPHCALCAEGALKFAEKIKFPICDPKKLKEGKGLSAILSGSKVDDFDDFVKSHYQGKPVSSNDTVSAVAIDANGHLACATSTGGILGKMEGRIGDAPLVGCGGYANKSGAATSNGHGEALMKMTLARDVVFNMEKGLTAQKSAETSVKRMQDDVDGYGGVIAIDKNGNFGKAFNTKVMIWATVKDNTLSYGMDLDQCETEHV